MGEHLHSVGTSEQSAETRPESVTTYQPDFINVKNFCSQEYTIRKMGTQATDWRKAATSLCISQRASVEGT